VVTRSTRAEVRNPLLQLPAFRRLAELANQHQELRDAMRDALLELRNDCRQRAEEAWRKHKAPMACYWKAAGVYVNHTSRVLK